MGSGHAAAVRRGAFALAGICGGITVRKQAFGTVQKSPLARVDVSPALARLGLWLVIRPLTTTYFGASGGKRLLVLTIL